MPWHFESVLEEQTLDKPNLSRLSKDAYSNNGVQRFALEQKTDFDQSHGEFFNFGNYSVWKIYLKSEKAKSLSFLMSNLTLPEGSTMYIYSIESSTIIGPISSQQVKYGEFRSDILRGESAFIEVVIPEGRQSEFSINIGYYFYGLVSAEAAGKPSEFNKAYGDALNCIPDVQCAEAQGWQLEADAVCMTVINSQGSCTGTLVTDDCHTDTPFILTARHCTNIPGLNLNSLQFRFRYRNTNCSGNDEPGSFSWITFTGAALRASSEDSDFSLLEMNEAVLPEHNLTFAGWDRSPATPNTLNILHHPRADVMKYSRDGGNITVGTADQSVGDANGGIAYTLQGGDYFQLNFTPGRGDDVGAIQPGSSGSSMFNGNHRIVAIASGGTTASCNGAQSAVAGRFSRAWVGEGTNVTRLQNWLGSTVAFANTNSYKIPVISGESVVCESDRYTINTLPGWTASWNVTPANLFSGNTSGTGNTAVLSRASYSSSGSATITYTLQSPNCGVRRFSKVLWVGRPGIPSVNLPSCFNKNNNYSISATASGATSYSWTFPNCPYLPADPIRCWKNYSGNTSRIFVHTGEQSGSISVFASNRCGIRSVNRPVTYCSGGGGGPGGPIEKRSNTGGERESTKLFFVNPNPVSQVLNREVTVSSKIIKGRSEISIIDINGRIVQRSTADAFPVKIECGRLATGVYFIVITNGRKMSGQKLIVQ